jgi:protein involved in polysaccharide export with SLBB domain
VAAQDSPARPGDQVLLRIVRDSVYTETLQIDVNGMVVVPIVGDLRLGGVAGGAVQDTLRARLARFVNPAAVQATLLRRVRVVGDVARPGVYHVDRSLTLRDVLALAGGPTAAGEARRAWLERGDTRVGIRDWRRDAQGLWLVESGDQLLVERLPWYRQNLLAVGTTAASLLVAVLIAR